MGINEYIKIGKRIKEARIASGLTQREMAHKLDLSYSTYSNYENGHREPPMNIVKEICDILGTDLAYLIVGYSLVLDADTITDTEGTEITDVNSPKNEDTIFLSFTKKDFSQEELEDIKRYAEFVKSKRGSEWKEIGVEIKRIDSLKKKNDNDTMESTEL